MSSEAIFAGIGAVITAAAGMALVIREFRNREHRAARGEIDELTSDLYHLDQAYIELRRYNFELRTLLADHGHDHPPPPEPVLHKPLADERKGRWRHPPPGGERGADVHGSEPGG